MKKLKGQQESNRKYQENRRRKLGVITLKEVTQNNYLEFITQSKMVHSDKYSYTKVVYQRNDVKVQICCPVHGTFLQRPDAHKRGQGCPDCAYDNRVKSRKRKTTKEFINEAKVKHNNKYTYINTKYTNIKSKVLITCDEHGDFLQEAKAHLRGQGCPDCANISRSTFFESKGEKAVEHYLQENNILFEKQKTFDDCRHIMLLRYDFYLPDYNTLIEYDGEQHYHFIPRFHRTLERFDDLKLRDEIKNKFAQDNNIKLLRIRWDQEQNIHNILREWVCQIHITPKISTHNNTPFKNVD